VQCSAALHSDVKQNKRQVCLAFSLVRGNKLPALANPKRRSQKKRPSARCSGDRRLERALGFHYQILPGSALPCRAKSQRCGARPARFAPGGGSHGGVPPWSPPPRKGPGPPQSEPWERLGCIHGGHGAGMGRGGGGPGLPAAVCCLAAASAPVACVDPCRAPACIGFQFPPRTQNTMDG